MKKIKMWPITTGIDEGRWEWRVVWDDLKGGEDVLAGHVSDTPETALAAALKDFKDC